MKKIYIGVFFIVLASIFLIWGLFRRDNNFVNLRNVIKNHMMLFSNVRSQYFIFYVVPIIMSIGISFVYIADSIMYQNIIVTVSILVSMLLAMLSIIVAKDYSKYTEEQQKRMKRVIKETNNAVVFCVFVSVLIIIISLIMIAFITYDNELLKRIFTGIVMYFIQILLLNILLIVKRLGKLI